MKYNADYKLFIYSYAIIGQIMSGVFRTGVSNTNLSTLISFNYSLGFTPDRLKNMVTSLFSNNQSEHACESLNKSLGKISLISANNTLTDQIITTDELLEELFPQRSSNFSDVEPGDLVFFAHVNKLTQLAIATFQQSNITHVGLVTRVDINSNQISVAEIPGYGKHTTVSTYNLNELYNDEELLFTSPNRLTGVKEEFAKFSNHLLSLTDMPENYDQYDLQGLLFLPQASSKLNEDDKKNLIHSFLEYYVYKREPHKITENSIKPKNYYCSAFVTEIYQLSQIAKHIPENLLLSLKKLKLEQLDNPSTRSKIVDAIHARWQKLKFWDVFNNDTLFQLSPQASTPATLYDITKKIGGKHLIVKNIQPKQRFNSRNLPGDQAVEFLEYQFTKLLDRVAKSETLSIQDSEVQEILTVLETNFGYSKESLNCLLEECTKSTHVNFCIESCLENTLTLKEKMHIFFISNQINKVTNQILYQQNFLDIVRHPTSYLSKKISNASEHFLDPKTFESLRQVDFNAFDRLTEINFPQLMEKYIDDVLPSETVSLTSVKNVLTKRAMQQISIKSLIKYLPLAFAYSNPMEALQKFYKQEKINLIEFTQLAILLRRLKQSNLQFYQINQILKLTNHFVLNKSSKDWLISSIVNTSQETGYNNATLNCIAEDFISGKLSTPRLRKCIETTLTLREKLWVYLSSHAFSKATDNLLDNPKFIAHIKRGAFEIGDSNEHNLNTKEALLNLFYPPKSNDFSESVTSYVGRELLKLSMDAGVSQFIFKDMFLGLNYLPQTEKLKKFLEKENLDLYNFLNKIYTYATYASYAQYIV